MVNITVASVKAMSDSERKQILKADLIKLILSLDNERENDGEFTAKSYIDEQIKLVLASLDIVKNGSLKNTAEIINIHNINNDHSNDINAIKEDNSYLQDDVSNLRNEVDGIQQYLKINNLEIVGLPPPDDEDNDESNVVKLCNSLNVRINYTDIDICHVIPSTRKDKKRVIICRFISRKDKHHILNAKKVNRSLKYKNNEIFIYEHLSQTNRRLYALASQMKYELNYKYLWTRNGSVFIRKDDFSSYFS